MNACHPDISRLAAEILAYLSEHPDAQDTLEGIAQWRIGEGKSQATPAILKEVLSDLVTQGLVEAHRETNGTVGYSAHRRQRI